MGGDGGGTGAPPVQEECERHGRRRVFDVLSVALTSDRDNVCYEKLGRELGVGAAEIKRLLHKLRQRYRQLLGQKWPRRSIIRERSTMNCIIWLARWLPEEK